MVKPMVDDVVVFPRDAKWGRSPAPPSAVCQFIDGETALSQLMVTTRAQRGGVSGT